jgi:hypothetical protein
MNTSRRAAQTVPYTQQKTKRKMRNVYWFYVNR